MIGGDRLTQGRNAENVGVMRVAVIERRDRGLLDGSRRVEIGIADREDDDILAPPLRQHGAVMDFPGAGTLPADALGET